MADAGAAERGPLRVTLAVEAQPGLEPPLGERRLRRLVRAVLANECLAGRVAVELQVVDDDTIRALNRAYRGKDRPTDVLSFPLDDGSGEFVLPPGAPRHLGAIVVSLPRALEQAREYGHSPAREFGYLVTHGLLHLLGYDHEAPEEQRAMRAREEAALLAVGLAR